MRNDRMLEEFIELVSIDAVSGQELEIAKRLTAKLEELGFTVTMDKAGEVFSGNCGNLTAIREGELDGALFLSSHMDRMPNGFGIKPVEKDGVLCSDGTTILAADDISGVCTILEGVRRAIASGKPLPRLEILFSVQEETNFGSKAADYSVFQAKMGYVFDAAGPTGQFINGAPGGYDLDVYITGKAAHAGSAPEKGINAAKVLCDIVSSLPQGRIDAETTANYPILSTGTTARNVICDQAHIAGEARSRDPKKLADYIERFKTTCQDIAQRHGAGVELKIVEEYPAFLVEEDHPLLTMAKQVCGRLAIPFTVIAGGGAMDANIYTGKGIPCVGVATGYTKNHTREEQMVLADFFKAGALCEALIEDFAESLKK